MKNILIALDYNPDAVKIAESGYLLSKAIGEEIIFLHVISDLTIYTDVGSILITGFFAGKMNVRTKLAKQPIHAQELSQDFLNKLKFHLGDNKIQTIIKEGNSAEIILETAKEFNVDLIVMGQQSRNLYKKKE